MNWFFLSALLAASTAMKNDNMCMYKSMFTTEWGSALLEHAECQRIFKDETTLSMAPSKTAFCNCVKHDKTLTMSKMGELSCSMYMGNGWDEYDTLYKTIKHECMHFKVTGMEMKSTENMDVYHVSAKEFDAVQWLDDLKVDTNTPTIPIKHGSLGGIIINDLDLIAGDDMLESAFLGVDISQYGMRNDTNSTQDSTLMIVSVEDTTMPKSFVQQDVESRPLMSQFTVISIPGKDGTLWIDVTTLVQSVFAKDSWKQMDNGVTFILERTTKMGRDIQIDAFPSGAGASLVVSHRRAPTARPTMAPTGTPTFMPTRIPTANPTSLPTFPPTSTPTMAPTKLPTTPPSATPTMAPTKLPSMPPTSTPTNKPTRRPTPKPTAKPTQGDDCAPLNGLSDFCENQENCGYDYANGECVDLFTCKGTENDCKDVKSICRKWMEDNDIKRSKKNLAACIIGKSEEEYIFRSGVVKPCCRAYVCSQSGNCGHTFPPTPEPVIEPTIDLVCNFANTACPLAAGACQKLWKKEGNRGDATEEYKAQCIVEWDAQPLNKNTRQRYWKKKKIQKPYPSFEEVEDRDCCRDFVCLQDPSTCKDPVSTPRPTNAPTKPDEYSGECRGSAYDCLAERRKCRNILIDDQKDVNIQNLSQCIQGFIKEETANGCCRDYVCSVTRNDGGLKGNPICESDKPKQTVCPNKEFCDYNDWDVMCKLKEKSSCNKSKCRWASKKKCSAGRITKTEDFECANFGIDCEGFKGCELKLGDNGEIMCEGDLDVEQFVDIDG